MGADIVIGVHLTTGPVAPDNLNSFFQVATGSSDVMINANELRGMEQADILITVNLAGYTTMDFSRVQKIIPKGYEAAAARSSLLQRLAVSDEEWKRILKDRESRVVNSVPTPKFVEVQGTSANLTKDIQAQLSPFIDKPIDTPNLEKELTRAILAGELAEGARVTARDGGEGIVLDVEPAREPLRLAA